MAHVAERNINIQSWLFLTASIVTEVSGTSFMAFAVRKGFVSGYFIMGAAIGLSYFFLAKALRRIPIGIAYAIWEGAGLVLLTAVAFFTLGEQITVTKAAGLLMALAGVFCVMSGEQE